MISGHCRKKFGTSKEISQNIREDDSNFRDDLVEIYALLKQRLLELLETRLQPVRYLYCLCLSIKEYVIIMSYLKVSIFIYKI